MISASGGSNDGKGSQRPRICHVPEYSSSAGDEAIELAAMAGLYLDDWQQFVLRRSLGERTDGKWSAPTVALIVGRQNGKNSVLEARELWGLFMGGEKLLIHTAHLQKTASEHFRRILMLIESVPELSRRVKNAPKGKGSEAIELLDGSRAFFMTRARGNTRGLTGDLVVFDEAMHLTDDEVSAIVPTLAARSMQGNTQIWHTGSAVDEENPEHDGIPFSRVRLAAMSGVDGVALFEWSAPGDDPAKVTEEFAADPENQKLANPGFGIRIAPEWIEHERTVDMGPRGFAVERLGIGAWPDPSPDAGRMISREMWAALAETDPSQVIKGTPVFAIDTDPSQRRASIAVAGKRADGLLQVAIVENRRGMDWVIPRCLELKQEFRRAKFVVDGGGPAQSHVDDLTRAKVRVLEATMRDYGRACIGFYAACAEKRLRYPYPQPELDNALGGAETRLMGDAWKWSRRDSTDDISPLVAATLAVWGAEQQKTASVVSLNDL